jgi:hypothetical protein
MIHVSVIEVRHATLPMSNVALLAVSVPVLRDQNAERERQQP